MDNEEHVVKMERVPATTPQRVAGANVLASLSDSKMRAIVDMKPPPPLPPIAEIATAAGSVQHDYLLQNLVHATKVTSPLPVPPGGGLKFIHDQPLQLPQLLAPAAIAAIPTQLLPPPQPSKSRKEKSLGVLCQNFMDLFKDAPPNRDNNGTVIEICQVAEHLAVKRRRIYDVINILESIDIVCRVKKNTYRWHGRDGLPRFFAELQKEGLQERAAKAAAIAAGADPNMQLQTSAKTKGMAQTCQKLIQIFLVTGRVEIGLTDAAEEVLGPLSAAEEANSQRAMKTKVRRMYDIANVLQSIGILQKENVGSTSLQNKPSFRWVFHILPCDVGNYLGVPYGYSPTLPVGELVNSVTAPVVLPASMMVPPPMMTAPPSTVNNIVTGAGADATASMTAPPLMSVLPPPAVPALTVLPPPAVAAIAAMPPMAVPPPIAAMPLMTVPHPTSAAAIAALDGTIGLAPVTPEEMATAQAVLPKAPTPPAKTPTPPAVGEQVEV